MLRARTSHVGLLWPGIGVAGSSIAAVASSGLLAHRPGSWWWVVSLGTRGFQLDIFWAGIALLCLGWAGLGLRLVRRPGSPTVELVGVGVLWAIPLTLGPALFSLDMYSYLAQGSIMAHGLNPYHASVRALHNRTLWAMVPGTWQHTTTPYGPVFVALASVVSRLVGSHLTVGVTLLRIPELVGLGLVAWAVPRLARALGADPARATWLALLSPLTLLYLVGGGHNDALMAGLMAAGVALAVERRPLAGIALCALAATIKLPAAAGAIMIAICWYRAEPVRWRRILGSGGLVSAAVLLGAGLLTGVGVTWISSSLVSTPATARMALTPSTAIAVTLWEITHHFGPGVEQAASVWEGVATVIALVLVVVIALGLFRRVRYATLARYLGLALIAAALGGPAAWPWYLSWGVILLAADRGVQSQLWLPVILIGSAFLVMPGGQVDIPLPYAWVMLILYALGAVIWFATSRRGRLAGPSSAPPGRLPLPRPRASVPPITHASGESSSIAASEAAG